MSHSEHKEISLSLANSQFFIFFSQGKKKKKKGEPDMRAGSMQRFLFCYRGCFFFFGGTRESMVSPGMSQLGKSDPNFAHPGRGPGSEFGFQEMKKIQFDRHIC